MEAKKGRPPTSLVLGRFPRARDTLQPVGVRRWIAGVDRVDGFVTGIGPTMPAPDRQIESREASV